MDSTDGVISSTEETLKGKNDNNVKKKEEVRIKEECRDLKDDKGNEEYDVRGTNKMQGKDRTRKERKRGI